MSEYLLLYPAAYLLVGTAIVVADLIDTRIERRRQAKTIARRLSLLKEFADGKRVD